MSDLSVLKYTDAEDKCFGVAGMALALVILDREKYIMDISIDRDDMDCVSMIADFFFPRSQSMSPKVVWKHELERLQLQTAMVISNMMSRTIVHRHKPMTQSLLQVLMEAMEDEACDHCQLDKDEYESIFRDNFNYLGRAYSNSNVATAISRLADTLAQRHTLSRGDLLELLS